jgi:hypothetical protein
LTRPVLAQWVELAVQILESELPPEARNGAHVNGDTEDEAFDEEEDDERGKLPWWKIRKWCMHIVVRLFERYARHSVDRSLCVEQTSIVL